MFRQGSFLLACSHPAFWTSTFVLRFHSSCRSGPPPCQAPIFIHSFIHFIRCNCNSSIVSPWFVCFGIVSTRCAMHGGIPMFRCLSKRSLKASKHPTEFGRHLEFALLANAHDIHFQPRRDDTLCVYNSIHFHSHYCIYYFVFCPSNCSIVNINS